MDLSIVILNWNAADDTIRCVRRFDDWRRIAPRVWVVDNASDGDDAAAIADACPGADVVACAENRGFSGGSNLGIRRALAASPAPILLLNNDASLAEADASRLLGAFASHPRCGIAGPLLVDAGGRRILSAGSRSPVLHRDHTITAPPPGRGAYPVEFVSGAATLVRPAVFADIGFFDESYFFALELADFCRRAKRRGYACLVEREARARHDVSRSSDLRATLYVYYVVRNRFLYVNKFYRLAWPALTAFWALYSLQQALRLNRAGRKATARAIHMGVHDGLRRRLGGQNERVLEACA